MSRQISKVFEVDTRRRWSEEEKLAIVEESKTAPVARVAKKHGVAASLLFRWRKLQGVRVRRPVSQPPNGFVRVALPAPLASAKEVAEAVPGAGGDKIEIVLSSGRRLLVGKDVDVAALGRIIAALER